MKKTILILLILLAGCKTKQVVVSYTNLRDSVKLEVIAPQRVANKLIEEISDVKQELISANKRSSIVASNNSTKQAISEDKKEIKIAQSSDAVKKVEARQEASVEKKQIQSEIVASRQLPKTIWGIVALIVVVVAVYVGIKLKKKIPLLG